MAEFETSRRSRRVCVGLAGLLGTNALGFTVFREIHHAHHQKLGVSPAVEPWLPLFMAASSAALVVTRDRPRPRAVVGAVIAAYYLWATSVVARGREPVFAAYGVAIAAAASWLIPPGLRRPETASAGGTLARS